MVAFICNVFSGMKHNGGGMASKGLRENHLSWYTKSWSGLQTFANHWNP